MCGLLYAIVELIEYCHYDSTIFISSKDKVCGLYCWHITSYFCVRELLCCLKTRFFSLTRFNLTSSHLHAAKNSHESSFSHPVVHRGSGPAKWLYYYWCVNVIIKDICYEINALNVHGVQAEGCVSGFGWGGCWWTAQQHSEMMLNWECKTMKVHRVKLLPLPVFP